MKQLTITLILVIMTLSCSERPKDKYESFYEIVDNLLRYNYYDVDIVILELNKIHKNSVYTIDTNGDTIKDVPSPPPPPGFINYNKDMFIDLADNKLIDSIDVDFMFNQIDTLKDFKLDSAKIIKQTLSYSVISQMLAKTGIESTYQLLFEKYNAHSYIKFSTPLVSKDGKKMIFDVDYHCGGLCGGGVTYLLVKQNDKWRITYSRGNWIS